MVTSTTPDSSFDPELQALMASSLIRAEGSSSEARTPVSVVSLGGASSGKSPVTLLILKVFGFI